MRFMMLMYPHSHAESGAMPSAAGVDTMMRYNEELAKAGVLLALDGLHPSSKGARISWPNGKAVVTDGPFTEATEVVGGYWLIQTKSRHEAVEWAKRIPSEGARFVELRQVFEMSDFPADVQAVAVSPEVVSAVEAHRSSTS